jgi:hypothetical protein
VREIRKHGSEGGEARIFPTPIVDTSRLPMLRMRLFPHGDLGDAEQ